MHDQGLKAAGTITPKSQGFGDFVHSEVFCGRGSVVFGGRSATGADGRRSNHQCLFNHIVDLLLSQLTTNHNVDFLRSHAICGLEGRDLEVIGYILPEGLEGVVFLTGDLLRGLSSINRNITPGNGTEILEESNLFLHSGSEFRRSTNHARTLAVEDIYPIGKPLNITKAKIILIMLQVSKQGKCHIKPPSLSMLGTVPQSLPLL